MAVSQEVLMTDEELIAVYKNVFTGASPHGEFLTAFAKAVVWADPVNFRFLREAAAVFARKYSLRSEAFVTFAAVEPGNYVVPHDSPGTAYRVESKGIIERQIHLTRGEDTRVTLSAEHFDRAGYVASRVEDEGICQHCYIAIDLHADEQVAEWCAEQQRRAAGPSEHVTLVLPDEEADAVELAVALFGQFDIPAVVGMFIVSIMELAGADMSRKLKAMAVVDNAGKYSSAFAVSHLNTDVRVEDEADGLPEM
jgi:hypothetical protein